MSISLLFARRYVFSHKSTNVINAISAVAGVGVAVTTAALIVVLSVFNGFRDLVATLLTDIDPQLRVVPTQGKAVTADDDILTAIRDMDAVAAATDIVEDMALIAYHDAQATVTVKGVDDNYTAVTGIESLLYGDGDYCLHAANLQFGILGIRVAHKMGVGARFRGFMHVYAPLREGQLTDVSGPEHAFVSDSLLSPGVVFVANQALYDQSYVITSIGFARRLFDRQGMVTALELRLKPSANLDRTKKAIREICGDRFRVLDRYEQQADTFRIMQMEKVLAYIFLTLILAVACLNIIGSLSMLILEKRRDAATLRSLGATDRCITNIFLAEGWIISAVGAAAGIVIGVALCLLQQHYGIVAMGSRSGDYIITAYPVSVEALDVALVFVTVLVAGRLATWWPVRYMARNMLHEGTKNDEAQQ